jgi:ABC-type polar amino acid transport system ATPase subunit
MLTAENIYKSYGQNQILKGIGLRVKPGKITALIGPSGSGKTTLLRCLSMLEAPNAGEINFDNKTYRFPLDAGDKIIPPWPDLTVVFQQLFLWPHLTLRENITLPLKRTGREQELEHLESLIDLFNMRLFIDRYPDETSLGQRQRAALVRALALKPKFILLDEITSSLDVEQVGLILNELKAMRDRGIGILIITHLLHFASEGADQIVFMDKGQVIESGAPAILKNPRTDRLKQFVSIVEAAT